jgi:hypothetical protein
MACFLVWMIFQGFKAATAMIVVVAAPYAGRVGCFSSWGAGVF